MADASSLDLRVLELTASVAGEYCGRLLAGFGARVVKVELPELTGDTVRNLAPFKDDIPGENRSGLFAYLNANKLGLTLDWTSEAGETILRRLVGQHDLVLLRGPGGLSHEELSAWNPAIVSVKFSPFGEDGPYRDHLASELTLQALAGIMGRTGLADREPLRSGAMLSEFIPGASGLGPALAAVYRARRTGKGCGIEISAYESMVQFLQGTLMKWSFERTIVRRGAQTRAANAIYPCADGHIGIFAPGSGTNWRSAAEVMEEPRLAEEKFKTRASRSAHIDELDALILPWTLEHTKEEIYHRSQAAGLPFGPVRTPAEVLASKHHRARGFVRTVADPDLGTFEAPGMPFRIDGLEWRDGPPPRRGEHTNSVVSEGAGLSPEVPGQPAGSGVIE